MRDSVAARGFRLGQCRPGDATLCRGTARLATIAAGILWREGRLIYFADARQPLLLRPPSPGPRDGARLRQDRRQTNRQSVRPREPLPVGSRQTDGGARSLRNPLVGGIGRVGDGLSLVDNSS